MGVLWRIILCLKPDFFFEIRFFLGSFILLGQFFNVQSKNRVLPKKPGFSCINYGLASTSTVTLAIFPPVLYTISANGACLPAFNAWSAPISQRRRPVTWPEAS